MKRRWLTAFSRIIAPIAMIGAATLAYADTGAKASPKMAALMEQVHWKKVSLEEKVLSRVQSELTGALQGQQFVATVQIDVTPPAGLEETLAKDPATSAQAQSSSTEPSGTLDGAAIERLTLGKLDLEAPVMMPERLSEPKVDHRQDTADKGPDLLRWISSVNVSIVLDRSVPDARKDVISKLVKSTVKSMTEMEPQVSFDKVELSAPQKNEDTHWDGKRWFVELKDLIAAAFAMIVLSVLSMLFLNGYRKLETRKIAAMEARNAAIQASKEETGMEAAPKAAALKPEASQAHVVHAAGGTGEVPKKGPSGFEKFARLLEDSPDRAALLVRQWLKAPAQGALAALAVLPQMLPMEQLTAILDRVSVDDRKVWKKIIGDGVKEGGVAAAETFISSQIVETLLVPTPKIDEELRRSLSDLPLPKCVEVATQDPSLGAVLMNLLPMSHVSRIYALMPPELVTSVTLASLKMSDADIVSRAPALKAAIAKSQGGAGAEKAPFLDKAIELLRDVDPARESSIYAALGESREDQLLESTSRQFFPAELVIKLPAEILKSALVVVPIQARVDLILSREDAEAAILLGAIGPAGSKIREVIDFEIQKASTDKLRARRAKRNAGTHWKEFVQLIRGILTSSEQTKSMAEPLLSAWLNERTQGRLGEVAELDAGGASGAKSASA